MLCTVSFWRQTKCFNNVKWSSRKLFFLSRERSKYKRKAYGKTEFSLDLKGVRQSEEKEMKCYLCQKGRRRPPSSGRISSGLVERCLSGYNVFAFAFKMYFIKAEEEF